MDQKNIVELLGRVADDPSTGGHVHLICHGTKLSTCWADECYEKARGPRTLGWTGSPGEVLLELRDQHWRRLQGVRDKCSW